MNTRNYAEVFAVSASFKTEDPLLWKGFFHPPPAPLPSQKNGGIALTVTKTTALSNIVGIQSLMRATVRILNWANLATTTRTDVGEHAHDQLPSRRKICSPDQSQEKSSPSLRPTARVLPGSGPGKPVTTVTHTRLTTMVVSRPRPPLLPPLLPLECAMESPTTRAGTRTRASLVHSVQVNGSLTAVWHTRPVRRRRCRGHLRWFRKMLLYLLLPCPITQNNFSSVKSPRTPTRRLSKILTARYCRREPALRASFFSARLLVRRRECVLPASAVPLGHGSSSARGTHASSAVPLSRGITSNSTMEVRATNAAPIHHGTGACVSPAPPRHASRSNKAAVTARRLFRQTCSLPPLPDHVVAKTTIHRDILRGSIRFYLVIAAGAL